MQTHRDLPRFDVTILLQAQVAAPVHVGAGSQGNIAKLWRSETLLHNPDAPAAHRWRKARIPGIPGRSLRGVLRDLAMSRYCDLLGIRSESRDWLRLLFKGGKLDKSGSGINLELMRWLREHCPPLALFGCMDNAGSLPGLLQVGDLLAWTEEGVAAGQQPRELRVRDLDGETVHPIFHDLDPVPLAMTTGEETGYRRDLLQSGAVHRLADSEREAIDQAAAAAKSAKQEGKGLAKEERREANESMPWTCETIVAGVPLLGQLKVNGITEIEYACLALTLIDWAGKGCPVGGKTASGFGKLTLRSVPAIRLELARGALHAEGRLVPDGLPGTAEINAYKVWLESRRDPIMAWMAGQ